MNKITQQDLNSFFNSLETTKKYESIITERINYVVRRIAELAKTRVFWWDFKNGYDENDGYLDYDTFVDGGICVEGESSADRFKVVLDNKIWNFPFEFPQRFLFNDFDEEVLQGIESYIKEENERQQKIKESKFEKNKKKKQMLAQVAQKLTPQERRLLKL